MEDARAPPYPADTRAKGWRFELDYERIEQSDTWDLAAEIPMCQHALLMMWLVAWRQNPCGSLPSTDNEIRAKCKIPPKAWAQCRDVLMRGWWLAGDGRLYHDTIASQVLAMIDARDKTLARKRLFDQKFDRIRQRDSGACVYCGETKYLSLDHLIAVSRGGAGDDENLVTACRRCNSSKGARTPDEAGMTFLNPAARAQWEALREQFSAFSTISDTNQTVGNAPVTRSERENNDTGTGTIVKKKPTASSAGMPTIPCPYDRIIDLYREKLPTLPGIRLMDDDRKKGLRGFWGWVLSSTKSDGQRRATSADEALSWIGDYFERASHNDWLMGRTERGGKHRDWKADLDFLLTAKGKKAVIERTEEAA